MLFDKIAMESDNHKLLRSLYKLLKHIESFNSWESFIETSNQIIWSFVKRFNSIIQSYLRMNFVLLISGIVSSKVSLTNQKVTTTLALQSICRLKHTNKASTRKKATFGRWASYCTKCCMGRQSMQGWTWSSILTKCNTKVS